MPDRTGRDQALDSPAADSQSRNCETHELTLDGVKVRLYAEQLAWDGRSTWLYRTTDGQVVLHDHEREALYGFDGDDPDPLIRCVDPEDVLASYRFSCPAFYASILAALGEDPVIEIGR